MYSRYILESIQIFSLSFLIGSVLNAVFKKLGERLPNDNVSVFIQSVLHLLAILNVSYILTIYHLKLHESYYPTVLLSSFLFSLQTNMIQGFQQVLGLI